MQPPSFGYFAPRTLDEALGLLTDHGEDAKLLAGGHSLIPALKLRLAEPRCLIDLGGLPGLRGLREERNALVIGALTVHADIASSKLLIQRLPGLADAASVIGDLQVRNRGTIGGSVAHADPAADLPVILTALDASFVAASRTGSRTLPAEQFFVDFYTTALEPDEILTEIRVPLPPAGTGTAYAKLPHPASGYVVVSAGVKIEQDSSGKVSSLRVATGGLGARPLRASATEAALQGKTPTPEVIRAAAARAAEGADAHDDTYASADYKGHVASIYTRRAIETALQRCKN